MALLLSTNSDLKVLGTAKLTVATPSTVNFDFGTPDDLYLPGLTTYEPGDRVVLVCTASCATPTTSTITWSVQDAPDSAGAIGTVGTAITTSTGDTLTGGTGDDFRIIGIQLQAARPWLRVRITHATATDSFVCMVQALAIPSSI